MCESPAIDVGLREDAEPNTVCHADDLVGWRDFLKGLRVLLVEDSSSVADIKSNLEQIDCIDSYLGIGYSANCSASRPLRLLYLSPHL